MLPNAFVGKADSLSIPHIVFGLRTKKNKVEKSTADAGVDVGRKTGNFVRLYLCTIDRQRKRERELSSNKASSLAAIGAMIETDAIPVVEKYHKKKERAIKRKMKQEMVARFNISRPLRLTRSCRNRQLATYTFGKVIVVV
ncbi:unnamed protein product [Eruca vesicaria subsp. sativa]|uniref:Uncharacterized protein n=1 Tax=Eruca vesicaria subsp. sativa TaxID=29727 RepID=A0ABC8M213_ERUVS|nr:unnamed protein product [Eruca vesicaria subsp. sativa]